jgi:class 3 adenylate cyclase
MSSDDNSKPENLARMLRGLSALGVDPSRNDAGARSFVDFFGEFPPVAPPQPIARLSDLMRAVQTPPIPLPSISPRMPIPPPPAVPKRNPSLKDDLRREVADIFRARWDTRDGNVVPADDGVKLGNDGVKLGATVLYADIDRSTNLVDNYLPQFAAEIYKTFLKCAARIIRSEHGEIVAYDGDRIMAVYVGTVKNTSAARTALKINYAVQNIVDPAIRSQYPGNTFQLKHVVGIDTGELLIAKTGIRNANDLVWVGRSANYAAKLSSLSSDYRTYITEEVYNVLAPDLRDSNRQPIWESRSWTAMNGKTVYASNYWWEFS